MAVFYGYTDAILGSQSTIGGSAINYAFAPTNGATDWRWTGSDTYFVVRENDGATNFNGDPTNEQISAQEQIGGAWEQVVTIGGIDRQIIWDYTFTVTDGTTTWRVGVIDVDFNNDDDLTDAGEDGHFLVFPDGMPPVDTDLTVGGIVDNGNAVLHADLGGEAVCFAAGTPIDTDCGPQIIETLKPGSLVLTRDNGLQPLRWIGQSMATATGPLAPIVIAPDTFGNAAELVVSPQHSILIADWRAELFFGQRRVLVRAVDLLGHDGVSRRTGGMITYVHLLFDTHQLIRSHGLWSESLYPGSVALDALSPRSRAEIENLVPNLTSYGPKAAPCLSGFEGVCLHKRHATSPGQISKILPRHTT